MAFAGWFLSRNTTWFNLRPRSLQDLQIFFNLYANSLGPDFIVCAKALSRSHRFLSIVSLISSPLIPSLEIDWYDQSARELKCSWIMFHTKDFPDPGHANGITKTTFLSTTSGFYGVGLTFGWTFGYSFVSSWLLDTPSCAPLLYLIDACTSRTSEKKKAD